MIESEYFYLPIPIDNYPQLLVIEHAEGEFGRESPGRFELKADVDGRRFHLQVNTAPLHSLTVAEKVWDFTTRLSHLSSTALVKGALSGTGEEPLLSAEVAVSGSRFNDVTTLFGHQSSENLPFSLRATLDFSPGHMQVGISELEPGSEGLDLLVAVKGSDVRTAEYSLSLKSAVLDLDTLKSLMSPPDHVEPASPGKSGGEKISREDQLLPEALPVENLDLILDIETLVIGGRQVSDVRLDAAMKNSRVEQAPFSLNSKHSQISGHCSFDFGGAIPEFSAHYTNASLNVGAMLEELGLLGTADDVSMLVAGLETQLHSRGTTVSELKSLMANSSGNLNFSVRPEKWRAGVVDLWAVNFFSYLSSFLTSGSESRVNCFAGRFLINQGILHQDKLLIDTSRIQVKGDVEIDFNKQYINAYLRPIPKRPQFFSLATPIKISGSYQNVGISLPAVGIIGTIVRPATSYIVVPIQWIILNQLPEDGTAACLEMIEPREDVPQQ